MSSLKIIFTLLLFGNLKTTSPSFSDIKTKSYPMKTEILVKKIDAAIGHMNNKEYLFAEKAISEILEALIEDGMISDSIKICNDFIFDMQEKFNTCSFEDLNYKKYFEVIQRMNQKLLTLFSKQLTKSYRPISQ